MISIHALREEGDPRRHQTLMFQMISIHALREEGDTAAYSDSIEITISIHALVMGESPW